MPWMDGQDQPDGLRLHFADRDPVNHKFAQAGVLPHDFRLRILISYHYYKDVNLDRLYARHFKEPYPETFLDCGAWSAFTQGASLDLDQYVAFIKRYGHLFRVYSNLDDMNDPAKTLLNQTRMEDAGLTPLPVFHTGEPWSYLEGYLDKYNYVALGKIIPYTSNHKVIFPWVIKCFQMAQGRAVFHGFGVTNWDLLKAFPWYSVDSSSWGSGFRYGRVPLFDARRGRFFGAHLGDRRSCYQQRRLFQRLGFDWGDFAHRDRNTRPKVCAVSALSYVYAERWLRDRHGPIMIPQGDGGGDGIKLHLADTAASVNLRMADQGVKTYLAQASTSTTFEAGQAMQVLGDFPQEEPT